MTSAMLCHFFVLLMFCCLNDCSGGSPASIDESKIRKTEKTTIGARATLHCHYSGYPMPEVVWIKNKDVLKSCKRCVTVIDNTLPGSAKLHVTPYRDEDFGEYECKVRNQDGFASVKFNLLEIPLDKSQCAKDIMLGQDPRLSLEYRPICDDDGLYHSVQCSIHLKKCWCVNRLTGHKVGDAYKGQDGYHCTRPTDLSSGSIVTLCIGIMLLLVVTDIAAFAFCNKGITHYFVLYRNRHKIYDKLKQHNDDEEGGKDEQYSSNKDQVD